MSHILSKFRFQQCLFLFWSISKCVIIQLRLFKRVFKLFLLVLFIMYIVHRSNSYDTFYTTCVQATVVKSKIYIQSPDDRVFLYTRKRFHRCNNREIKRPWGIVLFFNSKSRQIHVRLILMLMFCV